MKKAILMAAAAAFGASPAMAQDAANPLAGLNVTALVGLDIVKLSAGGSSDSSNDLLYGVSVGYDADLGSVLLGGEAEYSDSDVSQSYGGGDELRTGRDLYVGARLGVPFSNNNEGMVYVKAGYTNAGIEAELLGDEYSDEVDGYRLGAGVEYLLSPKIPLRFEYRYSDYGEVEFSGVATGIDASRHQIVAGLGYKF